MSEKRQLFTTSTTLVSIALTILGLAGVYFTPQNAILLIFTFTIGILLVLLYGKISQIDVHTNQIAELTKRLNIEQRFNRLERDIAVQRAKLAAVVKR